MQNSRTRDLRCSVAIRAGAVAQLGERLVRNEEVRGSTPLGSTTTDSDRMGLFCASGATRPPTRPLPCGPGRARNSDRKAKAKKLNSAGKHKSAPSRSIVTEASEGARRN